jgi:hypothetical protein
VAAHRRPPSPRRSTISARARTAAAARVPRRRGWAVAALSVAAIALLLGLATAGVATGRALDVTDTTTTDTTSTDTTSTDTTATTDATTTDTTPTDTTGTTTTTPPDTTPPVLSLPSSITVTATGPSGAAVSYTATANDDVDGPVTPSCSPSSGSTFPVGTTTVNCSAQDSAGNTASGSFTVTVNPPPDTTPPVLSLPSPITVAASGPSGAAVSYTATANDAHDGAVTATCSPSSGSTFPLGTTTVNCSAKDAAGNTATGSFTVTVQDTTPPTLSLPSAMTVTASGPSGAAVTYTATANDNVDGPVTPSCSPASGSTFPVGGTTVSCSAQDKAGNTANGSFTVTVNPPPDTTPPVLSLPSPITVAASGPSGTAVTYTATANDAHDGPVTASCSPGSGSTFPVGTTTVNCSAKDAAGNTATGSFTVTVQDTSPPTLSLPSPITVTATAFAGAVVTFTATASDLIDGSITPSCAPASGSNFAIGTTTVACTATDAAGNSTSATFTVTVRPPPVTAQSTPGDRTPPVITVPGPMTVHAPGPPGTTVDYTVTAVDAAAGKVPVACTPAPGSTFPLGATSVTCTATDANGNTASRSFTVTVVDVTPPPAVTGLGVKAGKGSAALHWQNPRSTDFDHVEIDRIRLPSGTSVVVYRGEATTFDDAHITNGVNYEYIVFAVDAAGNRAGVAVTVRPRALVLLRPSDGAAVKGPPMLAWVAAPKADYYNLQLYRGNTKVLSVWPKSTHYQLPSRWKYGGQSESLKPGVYRWYVFPGYGGRSAHSFGGVLGPSTFVVNG